MAACDRAVCIIHLIRNTFRLSLKKDWDGLKRNAKPIYTAPNPNAAIVALEELGEKWGKKYAAIIRLWKSGWEEFISVPRLRRRDPKGGDLLDERDRVSQRPLQSCSAGKGRFHDRAGSTHMSVSCTRSLDSTGAGRARWRMRWKPVLSAFAITLADRWPAAETY